MVLSVLAVGAATFATGVAAGATGVSGAAGATQASHQTGEKAVRLETGNGLETETDRRHGKHGSKQLHGSPQFLNFKTVHSKEIYQELGASISQRLLATRLRRDELCHFLTGISGQTNPNPSIFHLPNLLHVLACQM